MKKYILLLAIMFAFTTAGNALATNENKKCQNVVGVWVDCSSTNYIDKSKDNSITNTAKGGKGGAGGDASANAIGVVGGSSVFGDANTLSPSATGGNATIEEGAIKNDNYNKNTNMNTNINSNKADAKAAAGAVAVGIQGQDQGQGQAQSTDITIEDNSVIIHPEIPVTYNHITPDIGKTSADMSTHDNVQNIKIQGSVDSHISAITRHMATKLAKGADDVDVVPALLFENDFRTTMISKGQVGMFMGFIYLIPDGDEVTMAGMEGKAYLAAMDAGATHYTMEHTAGMYVEGSKAGIDFGGSASVAIAADGSAVIAPGATFGYSKAWSSNEYRPAVIITLYFDTTLTITPAK